jgi:hypothetical protein
MSTDGTGSLTSGSEALGFRRDACSLLTRTPTIPPSWLVPIVIVEVAMFVFYRDAVMGSRDERVTSGNISKCHWHVSA